MLASDSHFPTQIGPGEQLSMYLNLFSPSFTYPFISSHISPCVHRSNVQYSSCPEGIHNLDEKTDGQKKKLQCYVICTAQIFIKKRYRGKEERDQVFPNSAFHSFLLQSTFYNTTQHTTETKVPRNDTSPMLSDIRIFCSFLFLSLN